VRGGRIRGLSGRALLTAAVVAALVVGTSTAALALWTSSGATQSSATLGKIVGGLSGTGSMTTTFSPTNPSTTAPLTLSDVGSLAGTYSATASATQGAALASAVHVDAWPVASAAGCTASTAVGSGAVSGTWAQLPAMTGSLAPSGSAVWCTRSTPTSQAAAGQATANITLSLTLTTPVGGWTSAPVSGGFYLNTSSDFTPPAAAQATPALSCTNADGNYRVTIAWDPSTRSKDTYYGLAVAGTRVNDPAQGYTGYIVLSGTDVATSVAPDGPARVDVDVLDANQQPTGEVAATGTVTFGLVDGSRTVTCGG
jgi:hypothetical protein